MNNKYKIGDYIKKISNKSKIKWLIAFCINETVEVIDFNVDQGETIYLCKNRYGIIWRLRESEVLISSVEKFNEKIKIYTPEFIRDNLRLCGVLKNTSSPDEKPQAFESTKLNWLFFIEKPFEFRRLKRLLRLKIK